MGGEENPVRDPAGLAGAWSAAVAGNRDDPSAGGAGLRIPPFMTRQGRGLSDRWPLQDFLELGALVSAVPCARLHARQVLWEWGIGHLGDSAELVVTELTTNAVRASREMAQAAAVRLWLLSDSAQILILVWDASPQPPVLLGVTSEAEHGRGLMLVEAVSGQWGWSSRVDGGGKFVWAIVRLCLTPGRPGGMGIGNLSDSTELLVTPLAAPSRARSKMRTACRNGLAASLARPRPQARPSSPGPDGIASRPSVQKSAGLFERARLISSCKTFAVRGRRERMSLRTW
jgi:anti-sigma regulatory factor (Ser/Thr protein kinase)